MNDKEMYYSFSRGEVQMWIEQESSIHLKAADKSDPIELTAKEVREIVAALLKLADELDRLDNP